MNKGKRFKKKDLIIDLRWLNWPSEEKRLMFVLVNGFTTHYIDQPEIIDLRNN